MRKKIIIILVCFSFFINCSDNDDEASIDNSVLTELWEQQGGVDPSDFSFLHISDTHGRGVRIH